MSCSRPSGGGGGGELLTVPMSVQVRPAVPVGRPIYPTSNGLGGEIVTALGMLSWTRTVFGRAGNRTIAVIQDGPGHGQQ